MKKASFTPRTMRKDILEATAMLILQKGVKDTSLANIAKELNISKGTLYYHYASKSELVYDIATSNMDKMIMEIVDIIQEIKPATPEDLIRLVIETIVKAPRGKLQLYLLDEAMSGDKVLQKQMIEKYKEWRGHLIKYTMDFLQLKYEKADIFSHILLITIDGCLLQWHLDAEPIPFDEISSTLAMLCK